MELDNYRFQGYQAAFFHFLKFRFNYRIELIQDRCLVDYFDHNRQFLSKFPELCRINMTAEAVTHNSSVNGNTRYTFVAGQLYNELIEELCPDPVGGACINFKDAV